MRLIKLVIAVMVAATLTGCASYADLQADCATGTQSACNEIQRRDSANDAGARFFEGYSLSGGDSAAAGAYVANPNITPDQMIAIRQANDAANAAALQRINLNDQVHSMFKKCYESDDFGHNTTQVNCD